MERTPARAGRKHGDPQWRAVGPAGGYIKSFAVDRGGRVLAGGDDSSGLWGSDDDGVTWRSLNGGLRDVCGWTIATGPGPGTTGERIWVGDLYGRHPVLVSDDRGESWARRGLDLPGRATQVTAVLPLAEDRALIGTGWDKQRPGDGLWASDDAGASCRRVAFPGLAVPHVAAAGDQRIVAAVLDPRGPGHPGLHASDDGGTTWERVAGVGTAITCITRSGDALFAGVMGASEDPAAGVMRSDDGGRTWRSLGLAGEIIWRVVLLPDGAVVAGCMGGRGVARLPAQALDDPAAWQTADTPSPAIMGLDRNPRTGTLYACEFANAGVARSTDDGRSFSRSNHGMHATLVADVVADPRGGVHATLLGTYALVRDADLRPAASSGRSASIDDWTDRAGRAHGLCLAIHPDDPDRQALGTFGYGLHLSHDGGSTSTVEHPRAIVPAVAWTPDGDLLVCVQTHPGIGLDGPPATGVYRRRGHGALERVALGVSGRSVAVATTGRAYVAGDQGLWLLGTGSDEIIRLLAGHFRRVVVDGDRVLAASTDSVWVLDHPNASWRVVPVPFDPAENRYIAALLVEGGTWHVGIDGAEATPEGEGDLTGGLLRTTDDGATWTRLEEGLTCSHVWGLAQDIDGRVYAGTYGHGVFVLGPEGGGDR